MLEGYQPIRALWDGEEQIFPSEQSARWALRQYKAKLAEADALALHRGCLFVHVQRFESLLEQEAIKKAKLRYGPDRPLVVGSQ
jgi:hypothetical protein